MSFDGGGVHVEGNGSLESVLMARRDRKAARTPPTGLVVVVEGLGVIEGANSLMATW